MTVGRNIRALRKRRGLTLEALSALCGVSGNDLGRYERGEITPRPATVQKIARALGVPLEAIREGVGWTAPDRREAWELPAAETILQNEIRCALREESVVLGEEELRVLAETVKASLPVLVEHMKDLRPEGAVIQEILAELDLALPEEGAEERLTEEQWAELRDLLPPEKTGRGRSFKSNRLMLEGILYKLRTGKSWKELPDRYGRSRCVSDRLRLWQRTGVWGPVWERLLALGVVDPEEAPGPENEN